MSEVRSLLRNERLSRRIEHPHATYSSSGNLGCTVCRVQLRADSLWEPHLRGKPHRQNLQKVQEANTSSETAPLPVKRPAETAGLRSVSGSNGKKRKAESDEDEEPEYDPHKKSKTTNGLPSNFFDGTTNEEALAAEAAETSPDPEPVATVPQPEQPKPTSKNAPLPADFFDNAPSSTQIPSRPTAASQPPPPQSTTPQPPLDDPDAEFAAFQAAIAATALPPSPPPQHTVSALTAPATISAAPLSAEELAARSREEASVQAKSRREEEIEGEKEDAARALEEEFEEMEDLEGRVRRLRERREALRRGVEVGGDDERGGEGGEGKGGEMEVEVDGEEKKEGKGGTGESEEDSEEEYDEFEGWGMGIR
ncbi:hypothetical protein MMC10_010209 [Thelotrema lepadinum]|nr:hypothetical protein [Thelotrema lepadinum]